MRNYNTCKFYTLVIDDLEFWRQVKILAATEGLSVRALILSLLQEKLKPKA